MTDLLILTEGGGEIGLGHLMRCMAIHNAWNYGVSRIMVHANDESCILDEVQLFKWRDNSNELSSMLTDNTLILIDSYQADESFFWQIRKASNFVAVLDDYNRISYPVDLIICPGIYGKQMDYKHQTAITVGGPEYVILRKEILSLRKKNIARKVNSILICFGGSQPNENLYQQIINIFLKTDFSLTVVTGNDLIADKLFGKAVIYGKLNPAEMATIMASADIAICAAGQTINELTWLGIPAFLFKTTNDQELNWNFYRQNNLTLGAYLPEELGLEQKILSKLKSFSIKDHKALSKKLKNLLKHSGAKEICSIIKNKGREATGE